jgi:hypothetical protein
MFERGSAREVRRWCSVSAMIIGLAFFEPEVGHMEQP